MSPKLLLPSTRYPPQRPKLKIGPKVGPQSREQPSDKPLSAVSFKLEKAASLLDVLVRLTRSPARASPTTTGALRDEGDGDATTSAVANLNYLERRVRQAWNSAHAERDSSLALLEVSPNSSGIAPIALKTAADPSGAIDSARELDTVSKMKWERALIRAQKATDDNHHGGFVR